MSSRTNASGLEKLGEEKLNELRELSEITGKVVRRAKALKITPAQMAAGLLASVAEEWPDTRLLYRLAVVAVVLMALQDDGNSNVESAEGQHTE